MKTEFLRNVRDINLTEEQKEECRKVLDAMDNAHDYDSLRQVLSFAKKYGLQCWHMHLEMFKDYIVDVTEDDCFEDWMDDVIGDFHDSFPQIQKEVCLAIKWVFNY